MTLPAPTDSFWSLSVVSDLYLPAVPSYVQSFVCLGVRGNRIGFAGWRRDSINDYGSVYFYDVQSDGSISEGPSISLPDHTHTVRYYWATDDTLIVLCETHDDHATFWGATYVGSTGGVNSVVSRYHVGESSMTLLESASHSDPNEHPSYSGYTNRMHLYDPWGEQEIIWRLRYDDYGYEVYTRPVSTSSIGSLSSVGYVAADFGTNNYGFAYYIPNRVLSSNTLLIGPQSIAYPYSADYFVGPPVGSPTSSSWKAFWDTYYGFSSSFASTDNPITQPYAQQNAIYEGELATSHWGDPSVQFRELHLSDSGVPSLGAVYTPDFGDVMYPNSLDYRVYPQADGSVIAGCQAWEPDYVQSAIVIVADVFGDPTELLGRLPDEYYDAGGALENVAGYTQNEFYVTVSRDYTTPYDPNSTAWVLHTWSAAPPKTGRMRVLYNPSGTTLTDRWRFAKHQ